MINSDKIQYLQMIQEIISRMSTISSVIKGFSVTITVAIITIIGSDIIDNIAWLLFIPLLSLVIIDTNYLLLERKYRILYECVRNDEHTIDFSLSLPKNYAKDKISWLDCILSKSILIFHLPIIIIYCLTCIFIN